MTKPAERVEPGEAAPELASEFRAESWLLGSRLELRSLPGAQLVALGPHTYELRPGAYVVAFRYGVVVFFGAFESEQRECVERLAPSVTAPEKEPDRDQISIRVDAASREGLDENGALVLSTPSIERLQVVAHVLAKSAVLSHYEERLADGMRHVEARVQKTQKGFDRRLSVELLREIQEAFAIRVQTIGRVEMTEKPEITWDAPDLDRLYELLAIEFELRERDSALSRKLNLVSDSASTALDLIHTRRALRVEWYIVILILVEIVLFVYEIARH